MEETFYVLTDHNLQVERRWKDECMYRVFETLHIFRSKQKCWLPYFLSLQEVCLPTKAENEKKMEKSKAYIFAIYFTRPLLVNF